MDRAAPTVAELTERYIIRCHHRMALGRIKLRTIESYEIQFRKHILPKLGEKAVAEVSEDDLFRLIQEIAERAPATAERCGILLKSMFRQAERLGWIPFGSSAAAALPRIWVRRVPRAPSLEEVARLGAALSEVEQVGPHWWRVVQLVRLLALTGRRLRELMHGRRAWVNLDRREYSVPDSKIGRAAYHIPGPAVPIFGALIGDAAESPWLFQGMKPGMPMNNPYGAWHSICRRASVEGLTFHHLRHLHASAGRDLGYSLEVIGKLLGHRTRQATEIYAHWITDGYRVAAESTSALLADWLSGAPAADPRAGPQLRRYGAIVAARRGFYGLDSTCYKGSGSTGYASLDLEREPLMQTIFIQVKCELGKAYQVADEAVLSVEQVSEVYSISGQYDLLMKCYLDESVDIGHFVTEQIQTLPHVKDTFTIITFKAFS